MVQRRNMFHCLFSMSAMAAFLFFGAGCSFLPPEPNESAIETPSDFEQLRVPIVALPPPAAITHWVPKPGTTFQWQLSGSLETSIDAQVYDLDLFETSAETIADLHEKGRHIICYVSVGTWENWRPDKDDFAAAIIGKPYIGWEGEKWLDIRKIDQLGPILGKRFDLAKEKGCDAIEPDNIDGFDNDTGFPLTAADQIAFALWLAEESHKRDMSIGLKNDSELVGELEASFDWALTEDCHVEGWCEKMRPFVAADKAVFQVEYTDNHLSLDDFCPAAMANNFSAILKKRELDAWRQACS